MLSARTPISNFFSPFYQAFGDRSKRTNYSCYHIYPNIPPGQDMTQGQFFLSEV